MKRWSPDERTVIAEAPLFVMQTRTMGRGEPERCIIGEDREMEMVIGGGFGREFTTRNSLWM